MLQPSDDAIPSYSPMYSTLYSFIHHPPPKYYIPFLQVPRLSDAAIRSLVAACAATVDTSTAYTNRGDIDGGDRGGDNGIASAVSTNASSAGGVSAGGVSAGASGSSANASGVGSGGLMNVATMYTSRADQRNVTLPLETIVTIASRCSDNQVSQSQRQGQG